jgi:hypothetical protein
MVPKGIHTGRKAETARGEENKNGLSKRKVFYRFRPLDIGLFGLEELCLVLEVVVHGLFASHKKSMARLKVLANEMY